MTSIARLAIFHCGGFQSPENLFLQGGSKRKRFMPILCFVFEHITEGAVVVDAGLSSRGISIMKSPYNAIYRKLFALHGPAQLKPAWGLRNRLEELEMISALRRGLFTHLHFDHVGGLEEMQNIPWFAPQEDLQKASNARGILARYQGYVPEFADLIKKCAQPIHTWDGPLLEPFGPTFDLFQDGSALIVQLPGHTPQHQGVLLTLSDQNRILLCGDAIYDVRHLTDYEYGRMPKLFGHNYKISCHTLEKLRAFHRQNPDVTIIPSHDFEMGERCHQNPLWISPS